MDHPLRNEKHRKDQADRDQQVIGHPDEIDPEIPDGVGRVPRNAADQRGGDGDAGRGGNEIVKRQPDHLGEVRHGRFAAVALPVGVGGETDGGVKRQMLRSAARAFAD